MKIYNVIITKVFRDEAYGDPETTSCATKEIAKREFEKAVRAELEDYIGDVTDEDGNELPFDEFVECAQEEYDINCTEDNFSFYTSEESQTIISIVEGELITE